VLGLVVMSVGLGLAGWAPPAFEMLSGQVLPAPVAANEAAMAVWSGIAFVRVFGAVLFGMGAVLWTSNARVPRPRATQGVLFVSSAFAGLVVAAQQVAIWANAVGWTLVGFFAALTIITGIGLWRRSEAPSSGVAV
jgi:hypothetical protein